MVNGVKSWLCNKPGIKVNPLSDPYLLCLLSPSQISQWVCCHWWWLPVAWPCLESLSLSPGSSAGYHGESVFSPPPPRRPMGTSTQPWASCPHSMHPDSHFTQPWTHRRTAAVNPHNAPSPESPLLWRLLCRWRLRSLPCHRRPWSWPRPRQPWRSVTRLQTSHWTPRLKVGKMGSTLTLACRDRPRNLHHLVAQWLKLGQLKISEFFG